MKFKQEQYEQLLNLIIDHGYVKEDFTFVKRKGRIITQSTFNNSRFSYFLDDSMTIDEHSGTFFRLTNWEVKINNGAKMIFQSWDEVLRKFIEWISSLSK